MTSRKAIALLWVLCISFTAFAQQNNQRSENIKVAADILKTMISQRQSNTQLGFYVQGGPTVYGSYLDGKGALLHIAPDNAVASLFDSDDYSYWVFDDNSYKVKRKIKGKNKARIKGNIKVIIKDGDTLKMDTSGYGQVIYPNNAGSGTVVINEEDTKLTRNILDFFVKFAPVLQGTAGPNEFVRVMYSHVQKPRIVIGQNIQYINEPSQTVTFTTQIADLKALASGKLTEEAFKDKVDVKMLDAEKALPEDARLMGELLEGSLETSFANDNGPLNLVGGLGVQYLEDYGVIYSGGMSSVMGGGLRWISGYKREELEEEDGEDYNDRMLEALSKRIQNDLLLYGRMLTSIPADEMVEVRFDLRKGIGISDVELELVITVRKSVLEDYANGTITKEQAFEAIQVNTDSE